MIGEICQGKHGKDFRHLREHGDEARKAEFDVAEFSFFEGGAEKARHLKAVRHGNLRDLGKFLGEDRKFPSVGVFHSLFSDGQNDEILSGTGFLQAFEKVDVIAASQAAVSGDDDVAVFFAGGFPGVNGGKIQVALCDVHQSLMEFTEVRAAGVCPVLGLPEFGGGHQFHGLGDLHGAFHTLDPKFYGFHICSHK